MVVVHFHDADSGKEDGEDVGGAWVRFLVAALQFVSMTNDF